MKVIIDIPKNFERDYTADKFKDFFLRIIANINYKGVCGRYEKEIAEMFLKAFGDSKERNNKPCCRCDSKQTNADRIRNMSDYDLGDLLQSVSSGVENGNAFISFCIDDTEITMDFRDIYEWLQSETEQSRKKEDE